MNIENLEYKSKPFLKANKFGIYPLSDHGIDQYTQDSYVQKYLKSMEHERINELYGKNKNLFNRNGKSEEAYFQTQEAYTKAENQLTSEETPQPEKRENNPYSEEEPINNSEKEFHKKVEIPQYYKNLKFN